MPIASELGDAVYLWPKAHESASALDWGHVRVGRQLKETEMNFAFATCERSPFDSGFNLWWPEAGSCWFNSNPARFLHNNPTTINRKR
jgi:hypothetical protein